MSGFSADWLSLREPFDHAAREAARAALGLSGGLARWRERSADKALAVIDLGCGHGANVRALAPRLGGAQHWRLVDHDAALLAAVPQAMAAWARRHGFRYQDDAATGDAAAIDITGPNFHATIVRQRVDLAQGLASLDFGQAPLVTACALLDLVSAPWLQRLVHQAQTAHAALWFGMNVDGRTTWDPVDRDDARVHQLFRQHQGRDKGFGPALGPHAAATVLQQLAGAGYATLQTQTDWVIDGARVDAHADADADAPAMLLAMVEGMAAAAIEQDPAARATVLAWKTRRSAGIASSRLRVGHVDIVATPA